LPRVFAHRGLALEAPENTLLAFFKALTVGAHYLETDVHVTLDGQAVVSHDPDLRRVADRDVLVGQLSLAELRRIDLGEGQTYCSLAEALDAFPDARFNIDVKAEGAAAPTAKAVKATRASDRVLITSFDEKRRMSALASLPGVATSASSSRFASAAIGAKTGLRFLVSRAVADVDAVQIPERVGSGRHGTIRLVTPRLIRAMHEADIEVHVWTVNEPDDMRRLLQLGVDGLITDRCDLALDVVRSLPSS
jgi:glycerophosphoryl diester phosphodiesterase